MVNNRTYVVNSIRHTRLFMYCDLEVWRTFHETPSAAEYFIILYVRCFSLNVVCLTSLIMGRLHLSSNEDTHGLIGREAALSRAINTALIIPSP